MVQNLLHTGYVELSMLKATLERAAELLKYDHNSGVFTWVIKRRRIKAGMVAGSINAKGYRVISIDNTAHYAHRLAVLFMTGSYPEITDHINGIKDDNRWSNLRSVDNRVNAENVRTASVRSITGLLGVSPPKKGHKKFKAAIQVNGRSVHLGYHKTEVSAHEAYVEAKRKFHLGGTL